MSETRTLLPFERISREILVKREAETSPKFGKDPYSRTPEELIEYGVVNIDKPVGPTSHQVSAYVQKILNIKKGGHSGTLDPKVTGVLAVALGRATRIVQTLLTAGKEYIAVMHLHSEVEEDALKKVIKQFTGKIKQLPPIKSSVKRQWRYRKIYYLNILEIDGQDILLQIGCQAGTYIRKLCHDIGQELKVGAHMAQLRRTKAGGFNESTLVTLQDLTDALEYYKEGNDKYLRHVIKPVEFAVNNLPKIWVIDSAVESLCHGSNLAIPGIVKLESEIQVDEKVALMTLKEELIAVGTVKMISREMLDKSKGIAVITEKVFMLPGTYPRFTKNA